MLLRDDECAFTVLLITDINECSLGVDICGTGNTCRNSEGGYYCTCGPGYVPAVDRRSCIGRLNLQAVLYLVSVRRNVVKIDVMKRDD